MATFTWTASNKPKKQPKSNVIECQFGDGYSQRQAVGINSQSADWSLTFENRSTTDADAIDAFLTARGGHESFDWTPPDGLAGKYVCKSGKWSKVRNFYNAYTITAEFEQVFEP